MIHFAIPRSVASHRLLPADYLNAARQISLQSRADTLRDLCNVCLVVPLIFALLFLVSPTIQASFAGRQAVVVNLAAFASLCLAIRIALRRPTELTVNLASVGFLLGVVFIVLSGAIRSGFGLRAIAFFLLGIATIYAVFYLGTSRARAVLAGSLATVGLTLFAERAGWISTATADHQPHAAVVAAVLAGFYFMVHQMLSHFERRYRQITALLGEQRAQLANILDQLQTSLKRRRTFAKTLSHGTRTPLAGIQFAISLLENQKLSPAVRSRTLVGLARNAHRLRMMAQQLELAVLIRGRRLPTGLQALEPAALHTQIMLRFAAEARAKGVTLHITLPAWLQTDRPLINYFLLENALFILVDNAIKHQTGGTVDIRVQAFEFPDEKSGRGLRFDVQDEGPPLSDEEIGQLFTPFFKLTERQMNKGSDGLGLGLSVVRALCESTQGQWGYHRSETGSTFWFALPCPLVSDTPERAAA